MCRFILDHIDWYDQCLAKGLSLRIDETEKCTEARLVPLLVASCFGLDHAKRKLVRHMVPSAPTSHTGGPRGLFEVLEHF